MTIYSAGLDDPSEKYASVQNDNFHAVADSAYVSPSQQSHTFLEHDETTDDASQMPGPDDSVQYLDSAPYLDVSQEPAIGETPFTTPARGAIHLTNFASPSVGADGSVFGTDADGSVLGDTDAGSVLAGPPDRSPPAAPSPSADAYVYHSPPARAPPMAPATNTPHVAIVAPDSSVTDAQTNDDEDLPDGPLFDEDSTPQSPTKARITIPRPPPSRPAPKKEIADAQESWA